MLHLSTETYNNEQISLFWQYIPKVAKCWQSATRGGAKGVEPPPPPPFSQVKIEKKDKV